MPDLDIYEEYFILSSIHLYIQQQKENSIKTTRIGK